MAYISAKDYADRNNVNYRYVRMLASTGKIKGARKHKISGNWEIPENAVYPAKQIARPVRESN
jgi:uncharacterized HAD superfamily protein